MLGSYQTNTSFPTQFGKNPSVRPVSGFAAAGHLNRDINRVPTDREWQVVKLIHRGLKNKDIAAQLVPATTEHVIKNYLRVIYDKLGFWNRVELALWFEVNYYRPGEEALP